MPIWKLIVECAQALTREGKNPFTRQDIIKCIQKHSPDIMPDTINPIIQGLTDNLQGGVPSAGGHMLHSVRRGQFSLINHVAAIPPKINLPESSDEGALARGYESLKTENNLRDYLVKMLRDKLHERKDIQIDPEVPLSYKLGDDSIIAHRSDILITHPASKRYVSIEIKYKSAVTDPFKCRAYDAYHLKKQFGERIYTIMLFVRAQKGVSIPQAKRLSYWFDCFIGLDVQEAGENMENKLVATVEKYLSADV